MRFGTEIIGVGLFAFAALMGAAFAVDDLFRQHMWILFFVLSASTVVLLRRTSFAASAPVDPSAYMDEPIRYGAIATMFWGVAGLLVGVIVALQLAYPDLNVEPWFNFGRMRPLHTSAVVFAFGGNALITTSFYVVQRTTRARLFGGNLALVRLLGLSALHRHGGDRLPSRHHPEQGICRAGMVCGYLAHSGLGRLSGRLPRHDPEAQGTPYLRRQLVLPLLHRDHRDAARGQQPGGAGLVAGLAAAIRPSPACRTRSPSGGTATMRSASS